MLRNVIAVVAGVITSFCLTVGGALLAWHLLVGDYSTNKDALERFMVIQAFVLIPGTAFLVAGFVSWVVRRDNWWLGSISLLPLFVYGYIRGGLGREFLLSVVFLMLATIAAFVISRFKPSPRSA